MAIDLKHWVGSNTVAYDYKTAIKESLDYFGGDELAANVVVTKYLLMDENGEYLESNPDEMHHRLAKEFHRIEMKYENPMSEEEIFDLLAGFRKVVPQGSPMAANRE